MSDPHAFMILWNALFIAAAVYVVWLIWRGGRR